MVRNLLASIGFKQVHTPVLSISIGGEGVVVVGLPDWGREAHVMEIRRKEL